MILGPLSMAPLRRGFKSFRGALADSLKQPWIGVTQGGSGGKYPGAVVAARDANIQRHPPAKRSKE